MHPMLQELTAERLRELLAYDASTGIFTWRKSKGAARAGNTAGTPHSRGYWTITIDGNGHLAHRLAWLYVHGKWPERALDHINRLRSDCRIANLREVSGSQNAQNKSQQSNNTSGYMGVTWCKSSNRWVARITVDGKRINLGRYVGYCDTVNARKNAEALYGYHPNHNKSNDAIRETLSEIEES